MSKRVSQIMHGGSLHFAIFSDTIAPLSVPLKIIRLKGAFPTAYVPGLDETWIDFRYRNHKFSIHRTLGDYWFFVENPDCPESILDRVSQHFSKYFPK